MRRWRVWLVVLGVLVGGVVSVAAQGSLSSQVLRLLTRDNTWTGVNTYDNTVGLVLERGSLAPSTTTDRIYNIGGNLWFNGVLVATSAGAGTVTSVGLAAPGIFTVSGSPVVAAGTLTLTLATQTANVVWAGPAAGAPATPTFRTLVAADLPALPATGLTGIVPVANGGTGLASGTSGGVLGYTAAGTLASSVALTANQIVLGGGAGATPTPLGSLGTTSTVLHGNAAGAPSFAAVNLTTTVTGTLPVANGGTGMTSGTSGGIPYFSATNTLASSALLTANRLVLGGGAGTAPATPLALGTSTQVLHGNAGGAPTWGAVTLTTDVTGTLPVANGGTGATTLTGMVRGNGTGAFTVVTSSTVGQVLRVTGANTFAFGAVDLADTDAVTGALPEVNGGTGVDASTATNGQLLIGDGSGLTLATLTGTANQITVTNGAGSITLSTPQSIATSSTPQFARLGLGTGAGATAVITTTGQFNVGYFSDGNCGAADTIDWNSGMVHTSTLSAATCTYTFANPIAGTWYTLAVVQDGTGGRLVTWPTITWEGGAAPTLSTGPGDVDLCRFLWTGSVYYGYCILGLT